MKVSVPRLLLLILGLLLLIYVESGCAAKKHVTLNAPPGCYGHPHFSQPCRQIDNNHVRCDGVIYAVYCVRAKGK